MKPAETGAIYEQACRSKRMPSDPDEKTKWHRVLHDFEACDVRAALDAWWADTTPTQTGRPRGAFLPEPAELKPLVVGSRAKREAAARVPQDLVMWRCAGKFQHTCSGFVARGSDTGTPDRKCRCGADLHLALREPA